MIVDDSIPVRNLEKIIIDKAGKIFEEAKLFDVYKGKQVPEGKKSVAYSITFRAFDRTLTDEEVSSVMEKIINTLSTEFGARLRE